ncbi:hypothetical protein GHT09_019978 [Marmota monax]|uniref:Uncharacterized protein n=1 Tax=Marmota monax TaxID=9995 RepID=A0A834PI35_MARMO|nr:hypothetical protein GHT09_019978 [Marmota monax]
METFWESVVSMRWFREKAHVGALSTLTARQGWEVGVNLQGVEAHSLTQCQGASPAPRPELEDSQSHLHTCTNANHPQTVIYPNSRLMRASVHTPRVPSAFGPACALRHLAS